MSWLAKVMPTTVLVWSQILSRLQWRYSNNLKAMEKSRVRVNTSIAFYLAKSSGCYIRYPDIKANHRFLGEDGVHLSWLGNNVFLNILQGGIEKIVNNLGVNLTRTVVGITLASHDINSLSLSHNTLVFFLPRSFLPMCITIICR
jgi:hypothetical protein